MTTISFTKSQSMGLSRLSCISCWCHKFSQHLNKGYTW